MFQKATIIVFLIAFIIVSVSQSTGENSTSYRRMQTFEYRRYEINIDPKTFKVTLKSESVGHTNKDREAYIAKLAFISLLGTTLGTVGLVAWILRERSSKNKCINNNPTDQQVINGNGM